MAKSKGKGKITVEVLDQWFLEIMEKETNVAVVSKHIAENWGTGFLSLQKGLKLVIAQQLGVSQLGFIAVFTEALVDY